jgi:hypothetical protein
MHSSMEASRKPASQGRGARNTERDGKALSLGIAAGVLALALVPGLARAVPITFTDNAVFRADRTANPFGFLPTSLNVVAAVTSTNGVTPLPGAAFTLSTTRTDGTAMSWDRTLTPLTATTSRAIFQIEYAADFTNPWSFDATQGSDTAHATRQAFLPVEAMPFVENVRFEGSGSNLTVLWDVTAAGASRLDAQQISVWDITGGVNAFRGLFNLNDTSARSVSLASLNLALDRQYALEVQNVEYNSRTGRTDVFSGYWLNGWTPTEGEVRVAVPEPGTIALLLAGLLGLVAVRRSVPAVAGLRRGS